MTGAANLDIAGALGTGLPILLLQFVICIVLLMIGVFVYTLVTPFHERELLREGNVAAATVLSGAVGRFGDTARGIACHDACRAGHRGVGDRRDPAAAGDGACGVPHHAPDAADHR